MVQRRGRGEGVMVFSQVYGSSLAISRAEIQPELAHAILSLYNERPWGGDLDHAWDLTGLVVESQSTPRRFFLVLCCSASLVPDLFFPTQILPWDSDIDVQVSASTIRFLASYYNMTVHSFHGRDYMLEINPKYVDGSVEDDLNTIDGRYIDLKTGLFIDITTVRPKEGAWSVLTCKDTHEYDVRG